MPENRELLKVQQDIVINMTNVAYIELTGKGGADIHFVGRQKPLHLNTNEAEALREFLNGETVTDISRAA